MRDPRQHLRRIVPAVTLLLTAACVRNPPRRLEPAPVVVPAPVAAAPAPVATMPLRVSDADATLLRARELMVPVAGKRAADIPDSWEEARSGGRTHRAVDILAPRGTPVVAAGDGLVYRVRRNGLGGLTVYMLDPEQKLVYYYAHLDHYAEGLAEGQTLAKGDLIGYVGTTGNAPRSTPHLHFQVMRLEDPKRYWAGPPLDPRPFFVHDGRPNVPDRQATR